MDATFLVIGSGCIVCLMPLAIYLLYLANLNTKANAVLVPGTWDIASTLLGIGGFILIMGPMLLTLVDHQWRSYAFGNWDTLKTVGPRESRAWSMMATGYFLILLGIIPALIRVRRPYTAIYNVDLTTLEQTITLAIEHAGFTSKQQGNKWSLLLPNGKDIGELSVDQFKTLSHVTLRWSGNWAEVRPLIEKQLTQILDRQPASRSPSGGWFYTAGIATMIVLLFWMVVMVVMIVSPGSN